MEPGRGLERLLDGRTPRHDREVAPRSPDGATAERHQVVRRRELVARVGLAEQVLVLEEEDRVFAVEGGAEQTDGVSRSGRKCDEQAGDVGEDRLSGL